VSFKNQNRRQEVMNCCDRKARAASAQSFTLWQQATIEIMRRNQSIIACSRHIYMVLFFTHIPFVGNHASGLPDLLFAKRPNLVQKEPNFMTWGQKKSNHFFQIYQQLQSHMNPYLATY